MCFSFDVVAAADDPKVSLAKCLLLIDLILLLLVGVDIVVLFALVGSISVQECLASRPCRLAYC